MDVQSLTANTAIQEASKRGVANVQLVNLLAYFDAQTVSDIRLRDVDEFVRKCNALMPPAPIQADMPALDCNTAWTIGNAIDDFKRAHIDRWGESFAADCKALRIALRAKGFDIGPRINVAQAPPAAESIPLSEARFGSIVTLTNNTWRYLVARDPVNQERILVTLPAGTITDYPEHTQVYVVRNNIGTIS